MNDGKLFTLFCAWQAAVAAAATAGVIATTIDLALKLIVLAFTVTAWLMWIVLMYYRISGGEEVQ